MKLDLRDPESIAAWYRVAPKRHAPLLRLWLRNELFVQSHAAIAASRELVK